MNRNATVVTYNESSYESFDMTSSFFTMNNLCLKGFNMNAYAFEYLIIWLFDNA